MRPRDRTSFRGIVLPPQAGTTHAFGTLKATRPIAAKPRRALAVLPTTALPTILIRLRVRIIARRGLVLAPQPIPAVGVLTRHQRETRLPTTAVIRRRAVPIPHRHTPIRRRRRAVPTPPPAALTRLLAAAMEAVAPLIVAVEQLPTAVVAAVLTAIVKIKPFPKGPPFQ